MYILYIIILKIKFYFAYFSYYLLLNNKFVKKILLFFVYWGEARPFLTSHNYKRTSNPL